MDSADLRADAGRAGEPRGSWGARGMALDSPATAAARVLLGGDEKHAGLAPCGRATRPGLTLRITFRSHTVKGAGTPGAPFLRTSQAVDSAEATSCPHRWQLAVQPGANAVKVTQPVMSAPHSATAAVGTPGIRGTAC